MNLRIAVLAVIHANSWALDAVLSDVRRQGADVVLNLGDVLYGPLEPRVTFERLRDEEVLRLAMRAAVALATSPQGFTASDVAKPSPGSGRIGGLQFPTSGLGSTKLLTFLALVAQAGSDLFSLGDDLFHDF